MNYNYWKCKVTRRPKAVARPWIVRVIETDAIVIRCGTWAKAIKRAVKFQAIQNRTAGSGYTIQNKRKHWVV